MKELEKYISTFTEQLFPAFYRDEGPLFIAFVKAYYEWMEDYNEVQYHARRLPNYRDIDKVIDDFIVYFKTKYLADIQFTTASNKQLFIKNSLDFYRAKGTERAVDLYFKLIHGLQARTYYPADDLFRLSDNTWVDIKYLEVEDSPGNINFVGKTVYGTISNANAFVERLVRIKKGTRFINVFYIASVQGDFQVEESIYLPNQVNTYQPRITGSLTSIDILGGGSGFATGEQVYVTGGSGKLAKAIVQSVNNVVGGVTFTLNDGGFGYTADADILISERIIKANNVVNNVGSEQYFIDPLQQFETITENIANVGYTSNDTITTADTIWAYDGGGNVTFEGKVLTVNTTNMKLNFVTGSTPLDNTSIIYTTGNVAVGNVTTYGDVTATANVLGSESNTTLEYSKNTATVFLNTGDIIYQYKDGMMYANGTVLNAFANTANSNQKYVRVNVTEGAFRTTDVFYKANTETIPDISVDGKYNLVKQTNTQFGVININNTFVAGGNAYGSNTANEITIERTYSYDTAASFSITNYSDMYYLEDVFANDVIADFANVIVGANSYGMSGDANAGYSNVISDAISFSNVAVGSIESIVLLNPGVSYAADPIVVINEPKMYHEEKYDLYIENDGGNFKEGENIVGANSAAIGRVLERDSDTDKLKVVRLSINEEFLEGETITGQDTNITATITRVYERRKDPRTGLNADILGDAATSNGSISSLRVIDSGFGYFDGETVTLTSSEDSTKEASARTSVVNQGVGEGFYKNRKSFLSTDKYIHDGDFYQEYSYQVLTALPFDAYADTLKKVLHVAGTKAFGSYVGTVEAQINISSNSSITTV
jgi:hypothetical protein